jgi:hypothetical protein
MGTKDPSSTEGPWSFRNWKAAVGPSTRAYEVSLYSDARVTGEVRSGCGPYELLNPIRMTDGLGIFAPALVLRVTQHLPASTVDHDRKTDVSAFTGASLEDEIACLLSLGLGIRLMAGGVTRRFEVDRDPRGEPCNDWNPPVVATIPHDRGRPILPRVIEQKAVNAEPLAWYADVKANDAVALLRAARSYRDAIWIAESEPELAWLLLVAAIETAAVHYRTESASPSVLLEQGMPELHRLLADRGEPDLVAAVAEQLASLTKATARFLKFMVDFLPDPPASRPAGNQRLPWTAPDMKKRFQKIYALRSTALHEAIPFPPPMCEPPERIEAPAHSEIFWFLGAGLKGAYWNQEDLPMSLHMFEYVARGALLKWWRTLRSAPGTPSNTPAAPAPGSSEAP